MTDNRQQTTGLRPKTKIERRFLNGKAGVLCRVTNHGSRVTAKAFTLIELTVAVALLAMVLSFASVIFKVGIGAYRTAGANAEIMHKLRAITDQLNADFKGQIWNPKGKISFDFDSNKNVRSDSIVFFANGDFQSTGQYDGKTVVGNVAGIFYGQAANPDPYSGAPEEKILVRRQTMLTPDRTLPPLNLDELGEYCNEEKKSSLADLIADQAAYPDGNTPEMRKLMERPDLDPDNPNHLVMYMAEGVDDFTIQCAGSDGTNKFNEWRPSNADIGQNWLKDFRPSALKFTFTLYDSKGIIKGGRTFTHIVYLQD